MYEIQAKKRINSRKFTTIHKFPTDIDVLCYVKNNKLTISEIPYIFTHIALSDGSIIMQKDDRFGLTCSPETLLKKLKEQAV